MMALGKIKAWIGTAAAGQELCYFEGARWPYGRRESLIAGHIRLIDQAGLICAYQKKGDGQTQYRIRRLAKPLPSGWCDAGGKQED